MRVRNCGVALCGDDRRVVLVDHRDDRRHRGQVVGAVQLLHLRGQGPAHDQPHDHLGAFQAAALGVLGDGELRQLFRVLLEQLEELHVPGGIVEPGALAVHLVAEAAGGDDGHLQILRIALDRLAQGLAEPEAAPRGRDRETPALPPAAERWRRASRRSCGHITDSGEKQPWSSGFDWKNDRSNSAAVSATAICRARPAWPFTGGSLRGPPPSSATAYSSPTPRAKCE